MVARRCCRGGSGMRPGAAPARAEAAATTSSGGSRLGGALLPS